MFRCLKSLSDYAGFIATVGEIKFETRTCCFTVIRLLFGGEISAPLEAKTPITLPTALFVGDALQLLGKAVALKVEREATSDKAPIKIIASDALPPLLFDSQKNTTMRILLWSQPKVLV